MKRARHCVLLALLAAPACTDAEIDTPAAEISDSAGIRVVMNPPPETAPVWLVSEEPLVEIGGSESDPAQMLFQVRGAVRLSDSMIVVANGGSLELRWYDPRGLHLRTAGGEGDGPGELRDLALVGVLPGDSIVIRDIRHRTMPVYDRTARLARTHRLSSEFGAFPSPLGLLSDGSTLLKPSLPKRLEGMPAEPGVVRYPQAVVVAGPDGLERLELGEFPGPEGLCTPDPRRTGACLAAISVVFGRGLFAAAARDRMALATNDSFSVRVYDGRANLLHVVRQRRVPVGVEEGDFERQVDLDLAGFPEQRRRQVFGPLLDAMPRYSTLPAFRSLRLDRDGALWVEESRRPEDDRAAWQVFDRDGLLVGRVQSPAARFTLTDTGPDYILGVVTDDLNVERVRLHRLERPAAMIGKSP